MGVKSVFISSTGLDLNAYRSAAEEICKRLHLLPIAMEYFEAMGHGASEGSCRKVDAADVFVGLYAHRYGYIEAGHEQSVTEIEFDRAGDRGIERLCFLIDPSWPWPPEAWDYQNHERLQRFKSRLDSALIRGQFTTVDDLRVKLMQALVAWRERAGDAAFSSVPVAALQQTAWTAPAQPVLMVGREHDLEGIKQRFGIGAQQAARRVTVIRGWPGVGKTTLVNALAHDPEVRAAFPDGILWAALGPSANVLGQLLAWARVLGVAHASTKYTEAEITARIRAQLRDRRMLLIVDDVWEPREGAPFKLGGNECAVLFTTRLGEVAAQLAATPSDIYRLDQLSDEKAFELMSQLAPTVSRAYPAECHQIIVALEGLPLAIRVSARLLEAEAGLDWGIAELASELAAGRKLLAANAPDDRMDPTTGTLPTVAILLQQSTTRLSESNRERYALLGVFAPKPATFDLEAIGAVWEAADLADAKSTVRLLVDRGLLEPLTGTGRFQMHAVLVMHAKSLLS